MTNMTCDLAMERYVSVLKKHISGYKANDDVFTKSFNELGINSLA